jgi:hypothetical protein
MRAPRSSPPRRLRAASIAALAFASVFPLSGAALAQSPPGASCAALAAEPHTYERAI